MKNVQIIEEKYNNAKYINSSISLEFAFAGNLDIFAT